MNLYGRYDLQVTLGDAVIKSMSFENGIVNEGKDCVLNTFLGAVAKSTWYFGLIASGAVLNSADTLASHAGWDEVTAYDGNRKECVISSAASGKEVVSDVASFTMTAETDIRGSFLCNAETGTSGTLFSTALCTEFTAPDTSIVRVRYTLGIK